MTRINVVPVEELSDQHLITEYRELPRVIKGNVSTADAPACYCLGRGHVKWARLHLKFLILRFGDLVDEMLHRGFNVSYFMSDLYHLADYMHADKDIWHDYDVSADDLEVNRDRLLHKYKLRPAWYRWTKREKPAYYREDE